MADGHHTGNRRRGDGLLPMALATAVGFGLSGRADAQAEGGFVLIETLQGVSGVTQLADGALSIVMVTGETIVVPATAVAEVGGALAIAESAAVSLGLSQTAAGAAAAGAAGAGAATAGTTAAGAATAGAGAATAGGAVAGISAGTAALGVGGAVGAAALVEEVTSDDTPPSETPDPETSSNTPPEFTSTDTVSLAEGAEAGDTIHTLTATDADGDTLTFGLSGEDSGAFLLDPETGELSFVETPDHEDPADSDGNNLYNITVTVDDGQGDPVSQDLSVTVTDVNEAPELTVTQSVTEVAENTRDVVVATVKATDPEGRDLTVTLSDTTNFAYDAETGAITLIAAQDFETATSRLLTVTLSDGVNPDVTRDLIIAVTDVNEAPALSVTPGTTVVDENNDATVVANVTATDPEGADLTYSLEGADAARFSINSAGEITLLEGQDYEALTADGGSNVLSLTVTVSDGTNSASQDLTVTVTDVNEAPAFQAESVSLDVAEGTITVGYTPSVTDPELQPHLGLTYSLGTDGDDDADLFNINSATGAITFKEAPDFESPGDVGGDNTYSLTVTVSDGPNSASQTLTVTVTDVNEAPELSVTQDVSSVAENNAATVVANVTASDPENDDLTVTLSDTTNFAYDSETGAITLIAAQDFETATSRLLTVTVSDGTNSDSQDLTVTVTDVNEAPAFADASVSAVIGTGTALYTASAGDPDAGDTVSYSLDGTDAGLLAIDSATGEVTLQAGAEVGTRTQLSFNVIATDADGLAATQAVTLNAKTETVGTGDTATGTILADTFTVEAADFTSLDGGDGTDTVALTGDGLSLNLTAVGAPSVSSVEVFDLLTDAGAQTLTLAVSDVTGLVGTTGTLRIDGTAGDKVVLTGLTNAAGRSPMGPAAIVHDGPNYFLYNLGAGLGSLQIQEGVTLEAEGISVAVDTASEDYDGTFGDDTFTVTNAGFTSLDGGDGTDTVVLDAMELSLDLTVQDAPTVSSVEVFDLATDEEVQSLTLTAEQARTLVDDGDGATTDVLTVTGTSDDTITVVLDSTVTSLTGTADEGFTLYDLGDGTTLRTNTNVTFEGASFTVGSTATATGTLLADTFTVEAADFDSIAGGDGEDTVALTGDGLSLDLTAVGAPTVSSVEVFDLETDTDAQTLTLTSDQALALAWDHDNDAETNDLLTVNGGPTDQFILNLSQNYSTLTIDDEADTKQFRFTGSDVSLKHGVDWTLNGTGNADTISFTGLKGSVGSDYLNDGTIDGGAGIDTVKLLGGGAKDLDLDQGHVVQLRSIETIEFTDNQNLFMSASTAYDMIDDGDGGTTDQLTLGVTESSAGQFGEVILKMDETLGTVGEQITVDGVKYTLLNLIDDDQIVIGKMRVQDTIRVTVDGTANDDVINLAGYSSEFIINGGDGEDTVALTGDGLSLDLAAENAPTVSSVEIFDLTGNGAQTLTLDAAAIQAAVPNGTLTVTGAANDELVIVGGSDQGTEGTGEDLGFTLYAFGDTTLRVSTVMNRLVSDLAPALSDVAPGGTLTGDGTDQTFTVGVSDFASLDGGGGEDTVALLVDLDLTAVGAPTVSNVEVFDLTGNGAQTLTTTYDLLTDETSLEPQNVITISQATGITSVGFVPNRPYRLIRIEGDSEDTFSIDTVIESLVGSDGKLAIWNIVDSENRGVEESYYYISGELDDDGLPTVEILVSTDIDSGLGDFISL